MIHIPLRWIFGLILLSPSGLLGLEPLSPEMDAKFNAGVHQVVGCEGCHWEDPDRPPRAKIPTVCGDCHPGAHDNYKTSVHWGDGSAHAVCTDCHGVHGILPVAIPGSKAHRSLVCGTCHPGPMEELIAGPHGVAFEKTQALVCASCHSNHAVKHPTIEVVEPACETCHTPGSEAFAMGQRVEAQFSAFHQKAEHARNAASDAEKNGYGSKQAVQTLAAAKGQFTQARLAWHGLNEKVILEEADKASALAERATDLVHERKNVQGMRETGVMVAWFVILLAVIALHLKRKSLETES